MFEQVGDDMGPGAILAPAIEAIVDGLPGSVAFRDIPPGGAGVQDPEDAIDEGVVIVPGMPPAAVMGGMGQEVFDPPPETRIELIAASHGGPPFIGTLPPS
jgi:hypothetical protein